MTKSAKIQVGSVVQQSLDFATWIRTVTNCSSHSTNHNSTKSKITCTMPLKLTLNHAERMIECPSRVSARFICPCPALPMWMIRVMFHDISANHNSMCCTLIHCDKPGVLCIDRELQLS